MMANIGDSQVRGKPQLDAQAIEETTMRIRYARDMGIEEDLAVGIGILLVEMDWQEESIRKFQQARFGIQTLDFEKIRLGATAEATNEVARFLAKEFSPPLRLRILARLGGRPIRPRRTKAEYANNLRALLAAWPHLPRAAIN
jgi:hypothetical protein